MRRTGVSGWVRGPSFRSVAPMPARSPLAAMVAPGYDDRVGRSGEGLEPHGVSRAHRVHARSRYAVRYASGFNVAMYGRLR